jgi:hypothetical protein
MLFTLHKLYGIKWDVDKIVNGYWVRFFDETVIVLSKYCRYWLKSREYENSWHSNLTPLEYKISSLVLHSSTYFSGTLLLYVLYIKLLTALYRLCGLVVRVIDYRSSGPGFDSQALPKKSSGSGTGSTQPREYNWGATW